MLPEAEVVVTVFTYYGHKLMTSAVFKGTFLMILCHSHTFCKISLKQYLFINTCIIMNYVIMSQTHKGEKHVMLSSQLCSLVIYLRSFQLKIIVGTPCCEGRFFKIRVLFHTFYL